MASNSILFTLLVICIICNVQAILLPLGWSSHNKSKPKSFNSSTSVWFPKPITKCVPSDVARGNCLVCLCNTDGIFVCRPVKCVKPEKPALIGKECKPNMTYKKDHTICKCSNKSRWIAENCRKIFSTLHSDKALIFSYLKTNVTCKPNKLYLMDCNICQCHSSGFIQGSLCTNRNCKIGSKADTCKFGDVLRTRDEICVCSDVNYYIDTLCTKINTELIQELKTDKVKAITNMKYTANDKCTPHREYYNDCNHCICDDNRKMVCTMKNCEVKANIRSANDINTELPEVENENETCIPGQKYRLKCNTCLCTPDKELTCTTMICLGDYILDGLALNRSLMLKDTLEEGK